VTTTTETFGQIFPEAHLCHDQSPLLDPTWASWI